jgi:hypothetical protein
VSPWPAAIATLSPLGGVTSVRQTRFPRYDGSHPSAAGLIDIFHSTADTAEILFAAIFLRLPAIDKLNLRRRNLGWRSNILVDG